MTSVNEDDSIKAQKEQKVLVLDETEKSVGPFREAERSRTAILLLDFQNEFMKEGGKLHDDVAETMATTGVLRNVPKLVEYAR